MRLRVRFAKLGKVRWTSHRDVARMWERAFRRARLPVAYQAVELYTGILGGDGERSADSGESRTMSACFRAIAVVVLASVLGVFVPLAARQDTAAATDALDMYRPRARVTGSTYGSVP